jgi:hypothetical protein
LKFTWPHISIAFAIILQCIMWWVVKNDPFFGDAIASTSQAANAIFNSGLTSIFYPLEADPGHPTLYSYILAVLWFAFGKTLAVTHAYSCIWAVLFIVAVYSFAKQFLQGNLLFMAMVWCMCFATYLSQSAIMLNTLALMTFFLWAVGAVCSQRKIQLILATCLMCSTHLQAPFLLASLVCFDLYRSVVLLQQYSFRQWILKHSWLYVFSLLVFTIWLYLHYQHAGWLVKSPQYTDANQLNGAVEFIKAMLTIAWRLVDYGMITPYLILVITAFKQPTQRKQYMQWLVLLAPCCVLMSIFLSNTIGHRYFLAFNILAIVLSVSALEHYAPHLKKLLRLAIGLSLIAGNFLVYPGKNLGDATLAYRAYFSLEKKVTQQFPQTQFYTHAPIANAPRLTKLKEQPQQFVRIHSASFDTLPAIVQSNINAEFSQAEINYLVQNWYGKSYEQGAVYVNVFLNPRYYPQVVIKSFRQPSAFENWLIKWKQKLK